MWRAIRIKRQFTFGEIAAIAGTTYASSARYIRALYLAGVLRKVQQASVGKTASNNVYRLALDLGRFAPRVQRDRSVFNPNTRKLLPKAGDRP